MLVTVQSISVPAKRSRRALSIHDAEAISELDQLIASLEEHQRHENYTRIQAIVPQLSGLTCQTLKIYQVCKEI